MKISKLSYILGGVRGFFDDARLCVGPVVFFPWPPLLEDSFHTNTTNPKSTNQQK